MSCWVKHFIAFIVKHSNISPNKYTKDKPLRDYQYHSSLCWSHRHSIGSFISDSPQVSNAVKKYVLCHGCVRLAISIFVSVVKVSRLKPFNDFFQTKATWNKLCRHIWNNLFADILRVMCFHACDIH